MSVKSKIILPFEIKFKSDVNGGYADELHSNYVEDTEIVNYHKDQVEMESSMDVEFQSPFTSQWVGGRSYRHINLNTGSDNANNRPEGWHVDFEPYKIKLHPHSFLDSPPAYWTRDGRTKSPINVKNISGDERNYGNYRINYEFLQTSGRRITNNLIIDGYVAEKDLTTQFISGASEYLLPELNSATGSKSIIVERFSAPGSKEENSRGSLDREGEEMSPNIPLPFRNIKIRQPFYRQLAQHNPQFGSGSTNALLPQVGTTDTVTIHKINRNRLPGTGIINDSFDNAFVVHSIPRTDIQYTWITSSAITTAEQLRGYQNYRRHDSNISTYDRKEAFSDIDFITGSLVTSGSNGSYEVDNNGINSLVKEDKKIDLTTNTFSIPSSISASFAEYTNSRYTFAPWVSLRIGESLLPRMLRKNSIISVIDSPAVSATKLGARFKSELLLSAERGSTTTNYEEPVVTFKYKPLEHDVIFQEESDVYQIDHEYANLFSMFANNQLTTDLQLGDLEQRDTFYDYLYQKYYNTVNRNIGYMAHKYKETIWPREQNTGLSRARAREAYYLDKAGFDRDGYDRQLGTQRAFWRDDQQNRKRSKSSQGGYYSSNNFLSIEEIGSGFTQLDTGALIDNRIGFYSSSLYIDPDSDEGIYNSISLLEPFSSERDLFIYTGSVITQTLKSLGTEQRYSNITLKRGFTFDVAGEFNSSYIDFCEQFTEKGKQEKKSLGTLYRNTPYKALLTSLPEKRLTYVDSISKTEDEEIFINPKVKYLAFIGGAELNTGSFIQDSNNFSDVVDNVVLETPQIIRSIEIVGDNVFLGSHKKYNIKDKTYVTIPDFPGPINNNYSINMASSATKLYVGGDFTSPANYIAEYDIASETWSALGNGPGGKVLDVAFDGSDVYVLYEEEFATNILRYHLSVWNGNTWNSLGYAQNNSASCLEIHNGSAYIGGEFSTFSTNANRIVRYDIAAGTFHALSSGLSGFTGLPPRSKVTAIAGSGSDIYVAGQFTNAGTVGCKNIAKWDTISQTWSSLGSGIEIPQQGPEDILVSGSDIYVVGGLSGGSIRRWNVQDQQWYTIPGAPTDTIFETALYENDIYCVGIELSVNQQEESSVVVYNTSKEKWYSFETGTGYDLFSFEYFKQDFAKEDFIFSTMDLGLENAIQTISDKKPFQDSYEFFSSEAKILGQSSALVPEFNISDNMEFYVKDKDSDFRSINKSFLKLDGVSGSFVSAESRTSAFDKTFINNTLTADKLKRNYTVQQQNKSISDIDEIKISIQGIKKLLPYNGFFPKDRVTQIANLYSEYVDENLHGGIYSLSYVNDFYNDTIIENQSTIGSISAVKFKQNYFMAIQNQESTTPTYEVRIMKSNGLDEISWSDTPVAIISAPSDQNNSEFGEELQLVSASNGLNLFLRTKAESNKYNHIMHCESTDGISWTSPEFLQVEGSSPVIYISGSSGTSNTEFGKYFDIVYEKNEQQEKIIMAIGALAENTNAGAVYVVTGTLEDNRWVWSDKKNIYNGTTNSNNAGTGISILSCSSGYQIIFGEEEGDSPNTDVGNILVSTSPDAVTWTTPAVIAKGSGYQTRLGMNDIKAIDYNDKTYVFFSEPLRDIPNYENVGGVFCVTSSANNQWPSPGPNYLDKILLYSLEKENNNLLDFNYSYSIQAYVGTDQRLYYAFCGKEQLAMGYVDTNGNFQTTENDSIFRKEFDCKQNIAVMPYEVDNDLLPIFYLKQNTDGKIAAFKNNVFTEFSLNVEDGEKHYKHAALEPFFAPGILYNTIKSGIAVDWPCATGSDTAIVPYGGDTIVNSYYPRAFEMANYSGSVINETLYGNLRSSIDYRVPFENLLFPGEAFPVRDYLSSNLVRRTVLTTLPDDDVLINFINGAYIYGGYEPYISKLDFGDIDSLGPKRFSIPFVYRKAGSKDNGLYTLAVSNFLAETVKFFLKDEKMTTFVSEPEYKWKEFSNNKTYYMDIVLEKSPDLVMMEAYHSELHPTGTYGEKMNGRYFGYPVNKTDKAIWGGAEFTEEERRLIHNDPAYAPYTPPYFEGVARARISFSPATSKQYSLQEVFNQSVVENVFFDISRGSTEDSDALKHAMPINSSIDIFGSAQSVEITVDETTGERSVRELADSQNWVISPRIEMPVLDFSSQDIKSYENSYSKTGGFGRGMWSGYGSIPTNGKGIKIRLEDPYATISSSLTGSLLQQIGLKPEERAVGKIAETKKISEAIVVIPYIDSPNVRKNRDFNKYITRRKNKTGFEFIKIDKRMFYKQLRNYARNKPALEAGQVVDGVKLENSIEETSITEMIEKMKKYVMPPEMNFLEYSDIDPFVMYIFEFEHYLDQEDLSDIWQGVMPKIGHESEEEEITISHKSALYEFFGGEEIPENIRWMVFKVKKKAEYDYFKVTSTSTDDARFDFNKIIGRKKGTDVYSYNWPYDFFSLVELAKVDIELSYKKKDEVQALPQLNKI